MFGRSTEKSSMRATALSLALQAQQPNETPKQTVDRAEAFLQFLMKPEPVSS